MNKKDFIGVIVATIAQQFVGMLWYSESGFGPQWLAAQNKTPNDIDPNNMTPFVFAFLSALIFSFFLQSLIKKLKITNWAQCAKLGTNIGIVFSALSLMMHYQFLGLSLELAMIDAGRDIVAGFIAGVVLSVPQRS